MSSGMLELGIWVQQGISKRQLSLTVSLEHLRGCHKTMTATGPWENISLFGFAVTQSLVLTDLTPNPYSISLLLHPHFHLLVLRLAILFLYSFLQLLPFSLLVFSNMKTKLSFCFPLLLRHSVHFRQRWPHKASEMCSSSSGVGLQWVGHPVELLLFVHLVILSDCKLLGGRAIAQSVCIPCIGNADHIRKQPWDEYINEYYTQEIPDFLLEIGVYQVTPSSSRISNMQVPMAQL